jgi:hypothetical protein
LAFDLSSVNNLELSDAIELKLNNVLDPKREDDPVDEPKSEEDPDDPNKDEPAVFPKRVDPWNLFDSPVLNNFGLLSDFSERLPNNPTFLEIPESPNKEPFSFGAS